MITTSLVPDCDYRDCPAPGLFVWEDTKTGRRRRLCDMHEHTSVNCDGTGNLDTEGRWLCQACQRELARTEPRVWARYSLAMALYTVRDNHDWVEAWQASGQIP